MLAQLKIAFKNSIIYGIGNVSTKLVGFVLLPIYMSHLTIDDYGALALLEASSQILISVFGFGLANAFNRFYWDKEHSEKQKSMYFTTFSFLTFIGILIVIIMLFFSDSLSLYIFETDFFSRAILLISIGAALEIIINVVSTFLRLKERAVLYSVGNFVKLMVSMSLTIYFIVYLERGIEGIFEANIIGLMTYLILMIPSIVKEMTLRFEIHILKSMFDFSLPLMIGTIFSLILAQIDRFMLEEMQHISDAGIYSLGFKISNFLKVFIVFSIRLAISPLIYKVMDQPFAKRFYAKILTYYTFIVVPCGLMICIFSLDLLQAFTDNSDYWKAVDVIPIIVLSLTFEMVRDNFQIGLNILKRTKLLAGIIIGIAIINVILNYFLIPTYNTIGASMSTLICQVIALLIVYYYAKKLYPISYEIKKVILMISLGVILYFVSQFFVIEEILYRLLFKALLVLVFPIILYLFNFFDAVEIENLKSIKAKLMINK